MEIIHTDIPGVIEIRPHYFRDERGFFAETYKRSFLQAAGVVEDFVQDNKSMSIEIGTVRGLHFQIEPHAQGKLVSCTRGAVFDVAVDIRRTSPTFGRHVAVTLSAELCNQLYVPPGFAHGFCTLEPHSEVNYKVTAYYAPQSDRGVLWSDPALGIAWPVDQKKARLSDKDRAAPRLSDAPDLF